MANLRMCRPDRAYTIRIASGFFARARGLLATRKLPPGQGLLLLPCAAIHSLGMVYPIDLAFIGRDGLVLATRGGFRPWRAARCAGARAVLELPAGSLASARIFRGERLDELVAAMSAR